MTQLQDYVDWATQLFSHARAAEAAPPYPWQCELAREVAPRNLRIRIPTGFGKTLGVVSAWLFHRVVRNDPQWPLRLVWMLPMRVLVEQTEAACRRLVESGKLSVGVHVLMGGVEPGDFHLAPEKPAILIGTQDMLLSRALNRGYGSARARWPIDFGLLSQDTLWVLDEVQLMGVGLATALQLAAFRLNAQGLRPSHTWAMSATLPSHWIETQGLDTGALARSMDSVGLQPADRDQPLWSASAKPLERIEPGPPASLAKRLAERVLEEQAKLAGPAPLTLVVCNTVKRAVATFTALKDACGAAKNRNSPEIHLFHSRFRGSERKAWSAKLLSPDRAESPRVIVATQVIEAGVDLSADLLFTEVCPWPSLVQRFGRLARRSGTRGGAFVVGLESYAPDAKPKLAEPYDPDELSAAWDALARLTDVSPRSLEAFERDEPDLARTLYPFEPPHILLRGELDELFDTTADLSGGDLDVSRYIREGDERDVSVAWIEAARDERKKPEAPDAALRPGREALCAVPFLEARDWLCGKKSGEVEPKRLREGVAAWVWDYLGGAWRTAQRVDLRPGAVVLVNAAVGGYDTVLGFRAESRTPVPLVALSEADAQEQTDSAQDQEDLSRASWQTIAFHGGAVAVELGLAAEPLRKLHPRLHDLLGIAARWHDLGKAHPAFQGALGPDRPQERVDLAKSPQVKGRCQYVIAGDPPEVRRGFRHELASALALFDVLLRWAGPEHPSRLGAWAEAISGVAPRGCEGTSPSAIEREILELSAAEFDLVAYLVCSHHGKLRARLHASPADQEAAVRKGELPIRGIYKDDRLPPVEVAGADGLRHGLPETRLTLEPAVLGLSTSTGRSWTERVDTLRERHGPFALAYLEALLRAADVRASKDKTLRDPTLEGAVP